MKRKILLLIENELKEQLTKEAKEQHESLSSYIRKILYERKK